MSLRNSPLLTLEMTPELDRACQKKRKPQETSGSDFKRRCLRSNSVKTNEAPPEKEEPSTSHISHRHPRPRVSNARAHHQEHRALGGNKGNKYRKKQENAQRYKVFNKGRGGQSTQPQKQFMTQEFKEQHALEVDGRLLCKFFVQGRCTKGEECQLEHSETYNDLIKMACKFYIQGTCIKGATCPYMHKSIPCKFFHIKSRCNSNDNCRFSHDPLTDVTQKVLDALTQRDNELYELNRKAREPQTVNEEQNTNEEIVIPAVRPSFYQSSETTVEDEQSQPYNELQSELTEETETVSKSEDSLPLDQPGPVCYSVEALLGPQLFKPVLYTATVSQKSAVSPPKTTTTTTTTKTETLLDPGEAPYSVANVLRSQSMFRSYLHAPQSVEPAAASCELTGTQTTDDKYKVSHFKQQNTQEKFFKQTSPHVPEESRSDVHCLTKAPKVKNETDMGEITAPNLKLVAEQSTAEDERQHCMEIGGSMSQKCEVTKEVTIDKLGESGQGSKMFEDTTISSFSSKKSSLRREQDTKIQQIHETNKARKDLPVARNLKPASEGITTTNQENLETKSEMNLSDQSTHITQSFLEKRQKLDDGLPIPQHKSTSRFSHLFVNLNSNPDPISRDNRCSSDKPVPPKSDSDSLKVRQQIKKSHIAKTPTKAEITAAEIQENPETTIEMTINDQSTHSTHNVSQNRKDCEFDAILPSQEKTSSRFSHLFANLNSESDQTFHASSYSRDKPVIPKSDSATKAIIKDCPKNHNAGSVAERSKKSLDNFDKSVSLPPCGTEINSEDNQATKGTGTTTNPTFAAIKTVATINENLKTNIEMTVNDQPTRTFQNVSQKRQVCEFNLSHNKPRSRFSHLFSKLDSDSDRTLSASNGSSDDPLTPNPKDIDKDSIKSQDAGSSAKRTETLQEGEHKKEDAKSVKTPSKLFLNLFKSLTADADRQLTVSNPLSDKATMPYMKKVEKSNHSLQKGPQMTRTVQIMKSRDGRNDPDVGFVTARAEMSNNSSQKPFTSNLKRESDKQRTKPSSKDSFQSPFTNLFPNLEGTSSDCKSFSGKAATSVQNIQRSKRVDCSFTQTTKAVQFPRLRTESSENDDSRVKYVTASLETSNNSCQQSVSSAMPDEDSVERVKTPPKSNLSLCEASLKESTINKCLKMSTEPLQCTPQGERRIVCSESANKMTEGSKNGASSSSPHMSNKTSASQSPPHQSNSGSHSSVFKTLFKQLRPCDQE